MMLDALQTRQLSLEPANPYHTGDRKRDEGANWYKGGDQWIVLAGGLLISLNRVTGKMTRRRSPWFECMQCGQTPNPRSCSFRSIVENCSSKCRLLRPNARWCICGAWVAQYAGLQWLRWLYWFGVAFVVSRKPFAWAFNQTARIGLHCWRQLYWFGVPFSVPRAIGVSIHKTGPVPPDHLGRLVRSKGDEVKL